MYLFDLILHCLALVQERKGQPGIHQLVASVYLALHQIVLVGVQSLHPQQGPHRIGVALGLDHTNHRPGPVGRHVHPGTEALVPEGVGEAVVVSPHHHIPVSAEGGDLVGHLLQFLRRQLVQIQLIAEGTSSRHHAPGMERGGPVGQTVGHGRHMGTHGAAGVAVGSTVLDTQPVHGVGVVGAPDLGRVVEHAAVEASAAAGAALNKQLGELLMEGLQNLIHAQHKAVVHLTLALRRQAGAPHIGEAAVHVPLHIGDVGALEHGPQIVQNILPHLGTGEVQH